MDQPLRDTIPRLHRVIDHTGDQLIGLAAGQNRFEDCRARYLSTQQRLAHQGRGRSTASRVSDRERNWSPTRDCLQELMRWGAVQTGRLPSERKFLDRYREQRYEITDSGREMAELARESRAAYTDAASACIIEAHPYVRRLLENLADRPISYPAVSDGDIARGRRDGRKLADWALWGSERIAGEATVDATLAALKRGLDRFAGRAEKPSNKALAEAMSDGFAAAGFAAAGLPVDGATIKALLGWAQDLLLYDSSRYVPAHPNSIVVWGCADLDRDERGRLSARRRGRAEYGDRVAGAIIAAYRDLADADESRMAAPFVAVHRVRAQVASEVGVTRALFDRILADLVDGAFTDIRAQAAVYVGATIRLPDSEPAFRYHGARRLVMQINPLQGGRHVS